AAGVGAGHDPRGAARAARARPRRLRPGRDPVPVRAARDRSRPARRARRRRRVIVATTRTLPRERTFVDRLLAAAPLLTVFVWLCVLYGWEAWRHGTPWLFGDELELTQLSRGIAATGHAARRGEVHS